MHPELLLVPVPRRVVLSGGEYRPAAGRLILLDHTDPQALLFTALRFARALEARCDLRWEAAAGAGVPADQIGLAVRVAPDSELPAQGYELVVSPEGLTVTARDPAGAFYGVCTLIQLVDRHGGSLPCLHITDWPDFPARGVMLDVSRCRVPTMETLLDLVDLLAGWKVNQLQLYTEHTFAYRRHPQVWEQASPFTAQEILELDAFCRERFIELVPNQQSFGHLAPWLNLPAYKHLAEVADGFETPWGRRPGSFSLAPVHPESITFLRGLYAELLPNFSSRMFNVGGDETWDLGQGQSKTACERLGKGRVYLDFLLQIYRAVRESGRTPQFWGDIIVKYPGLVAELPADMIVLEWGYEAAHPFDEHGALFAASGLPFYVCPGTSSWCSISGRTDNAIANQVNAAENGLKHGAAGYLNTDWGDYGHWQVWPVSYLGFLTGAAFAWSLESNRTLDIPQALSWFAFRDPGGGLGRLAFDLGNVYHAPGVEPHNSSVLFWLLQWPLAQIRDYPGVSAAVFERSLQAVEAAAAPLAQARMEHPGAGLIRSEFDLTVRLLRHACRRGLLALADDPVQASGLRRDLAADLDAIVGDFRRIWLARNRPGGLAESQALLEKLHLEYAFHAGEK